MADDITVTDQPEVEDENKSPDETDFSGAFNDAIVGDDDKEADTTDADAKAAEAKEEEEAAAAAKLAADEEAANSDDDKNGKKAKDADKNLDADGKEIELSDEDKAAAERGKKLIEEEDKAKEEADKKAEEEKQKLADEETAKNAAKVNPVTADQVKTFVGMIAPSELPETLEVDGVSYDVKEYMDDNPEAQIISGMVTQRILERLVENGVIMTAAKHNEKMQNFEDRLYGLHFDTTVMRSIPDAMQIVETKEYKEWMEKTATKEDIALLGSNDPADYILGLNKFKGVAPAAADKSKASDKSKADAEAKAKEEKDKHDSIHSSTMSATNKSDTKSSMESGQDDFSNAFKEAETEAEKKKE